MLFILLSYLLSQGPIPGLAGEDYPNFSFPPETSFQCAGLVGGYYADQEADCQSYHICGEEGKLLTTRLCPLGTLYNQQYFICDWWFNVDCSVVCISFIITTNTSLFSSTGWPVLQSQWWGQSCRGECQFQTRRQFRERGKFKKRWENRKRLIRLWLWTTRWALFALYFSNVTKQWNIF